jgi:GTPase SAR1 family protein
MSNPYIIGRPVFDPENFYGREEEIRIINSHIENLIPLSLVGERGIGRTSLLHYISHPKNIEKQLETDRYMVLYFNFTGFSQFTKEQFWGEFLNKMRKFLKESKKDSVINIPGKKNLGIIDIYELIEDFSRNDTQLVFCFDGFDAVKQNPNFDRTFFDCLRHFITAYSNVTYVTASKRSLDTLELSRDILSSPFFTYFDKMRIGFLKREETEHLILKPSEKEGVQFNEEDVGFVLNVAYCHPLFVQSACHNIFRKRLKEKKINGEKMEKAIYEKIEKESYQNFENHFDYYWELLENNEKKKLRELCEHSRYICEGDHTIVSLEEYNLIRRDQSEYKPFSTIFGKFCIKKKLKRDPFG